MGVLQVEPRSDQRAEALGISGRALGLVVLGAAGLMFGGLVVERPITFPDEFIYADLARSFAASRTFEVAGRASSVWSYGPIYPLVLTPIFWIAPTLHDAYVAARALNALAFASAAVPLRLVAIRFLTHRRALFVAAAGIAVPASVYSTKLQTESLAYPLVIWTVLALLLVIARPTVSRQLALIACLVVAPLVRLELVALLPAAFAACLLCRSGSLRDRIAVLRLFSCAALTVAVAAAAVAASAARGVQGTVDFELSSLGQFAVQLAGTAAALDLDTGIVPFAVVLMLVFIPASRSHRMHWADDETRSLTAVTVSLTAALALISSFYLVVVGAPWRPAVPSDRYVFYVVPLFLILFLRWIEHGAPRDGLRWVAATAAALPLAVAATEIHGRGFLASGSALSFMPWMFIRALSPSPSWLIGLGAFCCLFAVSASTERIGVGWLVRLVVASGLTLTISAFGYAALGSWNATLHSPPAQWLDLRTDAPVVGVWVDRPTARQTFALWSVAMMNRNLHRVYYVRQPDQLGSESRLIEGPGGELLENGKAMYPRYVLTASTTPLIGRLIAQRSGLALYRVRPPLRLAVAQRFGASSAQP